jgi:hypothetical protein
MKKDKVSEENTTFTDGMYTKCPAGYKVYNDLVCGSYFQFLLVVEVGYA